MKNKKKKNMAKAAKPKGPKAQPATLSDLALVINGDGTVTTTVSPEAQWAGIQKFVDPTINDGAIALHDAQRNYSTPPGAGETITAQLQGTGYYRGWSSDFDYDVHLSDFVFVP